MLIFAIYDRGQKAKIFLRHKLAENFDNRRVFLEEKEMILCDK